MPPAPRGLIRRLSADLVNRIAAGEVIERPASVVKELVENALDAGATRVTVETADGGLSLVRVVDDGGGITPEELPLAFAAHATSKLQDDAGLHALTTMGFRGEALASVGSVARCRIVSRTSGGEAFEVENVAGTLSDVRPSAGNAGTTVEVRDLFFNTPARAKFLKSAAAESSQVTDVFQRLAAVHPQVHFRHVRDGRTVSDVPPADAFTRLTVLWPADLAANATRLDEKGTDVRVWGILAPPADATPTARWMHLYVNTRPVRDKSLSHAVREAFRGLVPPGRHPAAVICVDVPGHAVDVNVHPTKAEVRFREPRRVWSAVNVACRQALLGSDVTPTARPRQTGPPPDETPRPDVRTALADYFKEALEAARTTRPLPFASAPGPAASSGPAPVASIVPVETCPPAEASGPGFLQIDNTYLVVPTGDGLEIIDQHALHERVMFEQLLTRVRAAPLERQRLLLPEIVDVPPAQVALLGEYEALLERLGVEATGVADDAVAIHTFPSLLSGTSPGPFVQDLLATAEADWRHATPDEEALLHETLDMMACRAAVKAGQSLSADEVADLLAARATLTRGSHCPHGRPTTLRLTIDDLDVQFKRRGF